MEDVNVLKERFLKVQKLFNSKKKNKIKLALEILMECIKNIQQ